MAVHDHQGDYGLMGHSTSCPHAYRRWESLSNVVHWRADQTDNSQQATLANAALENVADRIELHTADMTALPLAGDCVDVILSSLAIHNIATHAGRQQALHEAVRVLRPGGRLAIADLWETRQHAAHLRELGWQNVRRRNLGRRMWYGGPWVSTRLVPRRNRGLRRAAQDEVTR